MNKIEKYDYENIKEELKKSKYIVYLVYVDTNKPKDYEYYKKILSFNGSHKELIKYLEKEYKNLNKQSFFIVFKFSFHTGTKMLQGGPLSITISSLVKEIFFNKMKNEYDTKLVSGYTKDNKYKKIHGKIWFQRKWLNINGWSDDYLDCMIEGLLSGKVKLLPLVVNMFNVYFSDICEKRKKKNTNEIYKLIDQLKKTEINKPTDTKEIEEKFKLIESLSKPKKKDKTNDINKVKKKQDKRNSINDVIDLINEVKRTKINNKIDKTEINKLIKQLEAKKEEPKKYKKSKDDVSDHPLSDFILNNSHLFSNRF